MAQGKMKVKAKLPENSKNKKTKGAAISKRKNAPIQQKRKATEEANKLKKVISKTVNKKMEDEMRSRAFERKTTLSKAQQAVIAHHNAKAATS